MIQGNRYHGILQHAWRGKSWNIRMNMKPSKIHAGRKAEEGEKKNGGGGPPAASRWRRTLREGKVVKLRKKGWKIISHLERERELMFFGVVIQLAHLAIWDQEIIWELICGHLFFFPTHSSIFFFTLSFTFSFSVFFVFLLMILFSFPKVRHLSKERNKKLF